MTSHLVTVWRSRCGGPQHHLSRYVEIEGGQVMCGNVVLYLRTLSTILLKNTREVIINRGDNLKM